jgi:hypothetical protein
MNSTIIQSGVLMDKKISTLKEVKIDSINWAIFYFDEKNCEKWVEEYPLAYLQAGGPPQLRLIEKFPWE